MCQTIYQYILTNFSTFHFSPPAHKTYSTRRKKNTHTHTHPTMMSSSSSGLIPTEVPHNINTRQFCLLASFREKKQTPFHPSQHVVLLPLVYSPFRPGRESWIWLWDDFGQSWRPWIRIKRRVIPICEKLCWSQNYKLGVFIKLKPFLFLVRGMSFFCFVFVFFTWRVPQCFKELVFFGWPINNALSDQIQSAHDFLNSRNPGCFVRGALFSLPAVWPLPLLYYCFCISCY